MVGMELRLYGENDRGLTVALESDPAVVGHLGGPVDEDAASRVHENRMAGVAHGDLIYTIVPDGASEAIGVIAIWRSDWDGRPVHELGCMLLPQHQARGVAFQAFEQLLPLALEAGVGQLHAFPSVTNGPSNAIMRKLGGFRRVADCDLDYEGRPLRCAHWIRDLRS
jgi:RimJ/RimL family protein N-acetyltransferase